MTRTPPRFTLWIPTLLMACAAASPPRYAPASYAQRREAVTTTGTASMSERPANGDPGGRDSVSDEIPAVVAPSVQTQLPSAQGIFAQPPAPPASPNGAAVTAPANAGMRPSTPEPTPARPMPPAGENSEEALFRWEALLQRDSNALGAGLHACRDICAAASNICLAAREICRITGSPTESHCARASRQCADAGRQRDSSCAVCP